MGASIKATRVNVEECALMQFFVTIRRQLYAAWYLVPYTDQPVMMMEVEEAKAWTAQLSKAETDVTHAAQVLEKAFMEARKNSVELG